MIAKAELSSLRQATRVCGGCTVCCTAMHVPDLHKPAGAPCPHQTATGCSNYAHRPEACRAWYCMWVRDDGRVFGEQHRPDRLGVFFSASEPDAETGLQTIYVHELRDHAAECDQVVELLRVFSQVAKVTIVPPPPAQPMPTPLTIQGKPAPDGDA